MVTAVATAATLGALLTGCGGSSKPRAATDIQVGLVAQGKGDLAGAKAAFARAVQAEPGNATAHYDLGVADQELNLRDEALQQYGIAVTLAPTDTSALYNEATILAATDPALAITTYRRVVRLKPTASTALLNLGLLELANGEAHQGALDLKSALTLDPTLRQRLTAAQVATLTRELNTPAAAVSPSPTHSP